MRGTCDNPSPNVAPLNAAPDGAARHPYLIARTGTARRPYQIARNVRGRCGGHRPPLHWGPSQKGMQAVWELGRFKPIGQKMQFNGGKTECGLAGERELVWPGLGDVRRRCAKPGRNRCKPKHIWRTGRQLGFMRYNTGKLPHIKPLFDPRTTDFPIVIEQVGATQDRWY